MVCQLMQRRLVLMMASVILFITVFADPRAKLDCIIHSWNEHFKKEKDHDYELKGEFRSSLLFDVLSRPL